MTDAEDGGLFEVEALLESRVSNGVQHYLVKWKGYGSTENSWEPRAGLEDSCTKMIAAFEKAEPDPTPRLPSQKRPRAGTPRTPAAAPPVEGARPKPKSSMQSEVGKGKSEYELARERTIERNLAMLEALGLLKSKEAFDATTAPAPRTASAPRRRKSDAEAGPRRSSKRKLVPGEAKYTPENEDDESWRPSHNPRTCFFSDGRDYGEWAKEHEWVLPDVVNGERRRKSCHICTQCVASWRGAFSMPLGCASCPLIWCSRCLSNIFNFDGSDENGLTIAEVIKAANQAGTWQCFKCRGACACQSKDSNMRGLTSIEKHKKWGWVGVTGNRDALCSKPKHFAIAEAGVSQTSVVKSKK